MPGPYLQEALEQFSGYIAVDELYDGPWCVLSIVDNHTFQRLAYRIVGRKVGEVDVAGLFTELRQRLGERGLQVIGITTDGSTLYPATIQQVFGSVPHQVCRFHAMQAMVKAASQTVVKLYKKETAKLPKLRGGRPARRQQRRSAAIQQQRQQLLQLYHGRYTLVARAPEAQKLQELVQLLEPYPQIAQMHELMQRVYGLYTCSSRAEALNQLAQIRQDAAALADAKSMAEFLSALNGPCMEKSLVYLDHPDLPATSNAVERSNRRHRKMQKSVYRVRSPRQLERRLALDYLREQYARRRRDCLMALQEACEA